MPLEILPVEPDEFASTPAAPDAGPPQIGPKNVYRKGQPQISATETVTIPNAEQYVLPKVVDENRQAEPVQPERKIEPVAEDDQMVPPSQVYDPKSDYSWTRGLKTSWTGMEQSLITAKDMARWATMDPEEVRKEMLARADRPADPRNARLVTPSLGDIDSVDKALTWFGEAAGSTAGSWLAAALYGGGTGAATGAGVGAGAGSVVPGLGTAAGALAGAGTGFTWGTGIAFGLSGAGGTMDDVLGDQGVKDGLKDGSIDPMKLLGLTTAAGLTVGAIDAFPATKMIGKLGGKEISKDLIKTTIKRAIINGAKHGAAEEGFTEGVQGAISELTQALAGGNWDLAQRALSVLDQAAVGAVGGAGPGAVGGAVENARIPTPGQDQADAQEAAPVTEPGVQTTPVTDAGQPAGGDTIATKPTPPAGSPQEAAAAAPATTATGVDPSVAAAAAATQPEQKPGAAGAGPAATPTDQPVVEEGEPTPDYPEDVEPVIPESSEEIGVYEQQQAELARVSREQYERQQAEDAARAQETAAQTPVVSTKPEDIAAAITATQAKRKPISTATTQAVDTGGNVAPIATPPLPAAPTPTTPEAPDVPVTATSPLAAGQVAQPLENAAATAQGTAGIPEQIAQAAGAPATAEAPAAPAAAPVAPAPAPVAPEPAPVAALQPAAQPAAAPVIEPVTAEDQFTPVAPRAELVKRTSLQREQAAAPVAPAPAAAAPAKPLSKAEQIKRRMAGRKTVEIPKRTAEPAERVEPAAAPQARPAAPTQPAPAPAATAAKKAAAVRQASSDVAARVRQHPELTKSRISELDDSLIGGTVEDVTREVATHEVENAQGRSLSEIIKAVADRHGEILAEVKKRLAPKLEEHEAQFKPVDKSVAAKEAAAKREAEAREAQAKVEKQAAAKKGTEKERAGKGKGLSPTGIRARSPDTWIKQAREQAGKEGADARVAKIRELVLEQRRASTPEARKAEAEKEWKAIVEEIAKERETAVAAEAKAAETGINKEHRETERQLKNATAHLPLPALTGSESHQATQLKNHLAAFLKAIDKIKVAAVHSSEHNSPIENLAVFAHKLRQGERDVEGMGPLEFWQAQMYAEAGAVDELRGLTTNEKIKGSELKEEVTEDAETGGKLTAIHEDETSTKSRVHAETVTAGEVGLGDLALRGKGGRQAAVNRAQAEARRADRSRKGVHTIEALDKDGNPIEIEADTASGAARLQELDSSELPDRGFFSLFRNMHIRRLTQLVGNVPVHIISSADMQRLKGNALGLYRGYSDADRARGLQPEIFITEEAANGMADLAYGHVLVHELTHAATAMAYRENVRGTKKLIDRMRVALIKDLKRQGFDEYSLNEAGIDYGLFQANSEIAGLEFIAEAFSNPEFQAMLARLNVPRSIQADVASIGGRLQSWWDAFTAAVSNAIGMISGRRGATYMETVVALHPHLMRSSVWQDTRARENDFAKMMEQLAGEGDYTRLPRAVPNGPADTLMLTAELKQRVQDIKENAATGWLTVKRQKIANALRTTGELKRRAEELFGGIDNPFNRLADVLLRKAPLVKKFRSMGARIEEQLQAFEHKNPEMYRRLSEFLHEASRLGIDPMVGLNHIYNKHIAKTGVRSLGRRTAHAEMAREWAQFPADVQQMARDAAEHYRKMHELESAATITYIVKSAVKAWRKALPAGKTIDDVVEWVRSGAAARLPEEQTAEDKAMHAALGETAKRLGDIPELRRLNGLYFPLARRGKWFVTAIEKLATPAGAVADPTSPDGNRFLFLDEKKLTDFVENSDYMVNVTSRWIDPLTGKRTIKSDDKVDPATGQLVHPVQQFVATVQNKRLEMHDNRAVLQKRADELRAAGHEVHAIGLTANDLHNRVAQIAPSQVAALIRNSEQSTIGQTTIGQQAVRNAIVESAIRTMTTPSALTHRLKRKGTLGYSLDLNSAMREYNRSTASHLANLELASEMAEHEAALKDYMDKRRHTESGLRFEQLQLLVKELSDRFQATSAREDTTTNRFVDALMNVSFMRHLFSPHYTIINMLQPFMTTYPILAAKYGDGAAWRAIIEAYRIGGVKKTLGQGFTETFAAARNLNPLSPARITEAELNGRGVHDQVWHDLVAGEPDAADLHDVFGGVGERGFGADSGMEAGSAAEADMNLGEKTLARLANVAKGLPEAAEGINRYTTAIAAYRLARRAGKDHATAKAEAISMVEQTQGGYARANNPIFMQNPLLRLPLQFKKYGLMYGQMYYGNLAKLVAPSTDPEQRKMAAKALARLSATTMIFAGVGGLPFVEIARVLANTAVMMGLTDDDWDDDENGMQQWFADFLNFATGSEELGNRLSEAATHGLTRLAGIDTANSLGADNLVTFGQPKSMDEQGTLAWLAKSAIGASGGMVVDSIKAINQGDYADVIPWPKVIKNLTEAIGLYTEGSISKTSGVEYAAPVNIGEAIVQGLGFQPASKARQWETTGGGRQAKEDRQVNYERNKLFDKWNYARLRGGDPARVFAEDIREWNLAHPDRRITMGNLMQSKRQHDKETRDRERAAAAQ